MKKYYVYFIQERPIPGSGLKGLVKIGRSHNPKSRLKAMQNANPRQLDLVLVLGPYSLEQSKFFESDFHRIADEYRFRNEWFTADVMQDLDFGKLDLEQDVRVRPGWRTTRDVDMMLDPETGEPL